MNSMHVVLIIEDGRVIACVGNIAGVEVTTIVYQGRDGSYQTTQTNSVEDIEQYKQEYTQGLPQPW